MRYITTSLLSILLLLIQPGWSLAVQVPPAPNKPDQDVRQINRDARLGPASRRLAAADALSRVVPGVQLRWDHLSGSPKWIAAPAGLALSEARDASPVQIARGFLADRPDLFGLDATGVAQLELTSSVPGPGDTTHLYFTQRSGGLEVFDGRVNITIDRRGRVLWLGSRLFGDVESSKNPVVPAREALARAASDVYPDRLTSGQVLRPAKPSDIAREVVFAEREFGRPPSARLVILGMRDDSRLAWEVRIAEPGFATDYLILIDAIDGRQLVRRNLTQYASGHVLLADHPDPESEEYAPPQFVGTEFPVATPESPQGWIAGDGTQLQGNNAVGHPGSLDQPPLSSPTGNYDYQFNTADSALVNAWFWINEAHDRFYAAGFDENAGNFQLDNFGRGGSDSDPVDLVAAPNGKPYYDSPAAHFVTTPDGEPPSLSFGWKNSCRYCADHDGFPENGGDRSIGFMRDLLFHEYAHGVTNRRVGGPADVTCLTGTQSRVMAEGWSDLFGASFFDNPRTGEYFTEGQGWLRDTRQDLDYGDLCKLNQPDLGYGCSWFEIEGMLWSGTLWDLRQSMIALDPAAGLADFDRLVVESLASTPCQPTLLDGRDAILAADTLLFSSAHHAIIWNVFAARGMGVSASTIDENDEDPVTDYGVPSAQQCTAPQTPDAPTVAVDGENRIRLDFSASDAAAVEIWRDDLDNPADSAVRVDFTTATTNYLDTTVQGGKSYRYHVVALGQAGVLCRSGPSVMADITATGECTAEFPLFVPELTVTDGDPSCAVTLAWNAATPACPGAAEAIVYNIYRGDSTMPDLGGFTPGFMPSDRLLVGRTDGTTLVDAPPELDEGIGWFASAPYYLVLAQHGTLDDAPDHRDRGASQVMDWEPGLPTLGRTTRFFWDFDTGPQGWTSQDLFGIPPENHWALADPSQTRWGGTLLAPDEAAGGSGMAWVTGDAAGGPSNVTSHNCEELQVLNSPRWDATDGSTILSFDYWAHSGDELYASLFFNFLPGSGSAGTPRELGMLTTQRFLGPGRYGWQRFEVDLSRDGLPSTDSWVQIGGADCSKLAEFGIDNVRIEQAVVCSRSWLRLDGVTVDDTRPAWGNGNGQLEPGEIARLIPALRNDGSSTAFAPSGQVYSRVPGVSILDATASFPDIPSDAVASATADDFLVALPMDAACDGTVIFEFVFTDQGGQRTTAVFAPEWGELVTDPLLEDDFETDQAWESVDASPGQGKWERGRPRGTLHGASLANPESDSPGDAGTQCYVTGNQGVTAFDDDVDPGVSPRLTSPPIAVNGYKRVHFDFDLWGYTSNTQDELDYRLITDANSWLVYESTRFQGNFEWEPKRLTIDVNPWTLEGLDLRLTFLATDHGTDDVVEYGVDNVRIAGEYQFCDTSAILPPNAVGDTLTLSKTGSTVNFSWGLPSADASHDPAVYFKLHGSDRPMEGFSTIEASTLPSAGIVASSSTRYFIVSAHNGGGSSGEEPAP